LANFLRVLFFINFLLDKTAKIRYTNPTIPQMKINGEKFAKNDISLEKIWYCLSTIPAE